ncbi:MAG: hypothetical protein ACFFFY_04820, partial [Promethearchaeota archaeon]
IIRALLLLSISLIYNIIIGLGISFEKNLNEMKWIWAWNVLQTISISLLLAWPLLHTSRLLRIFLGIGLLVVNELLLTYLLPYEDQQNFYGVLFHIFYHPKEAFVIIPYFAIFIIGSACGDFFFDINNIKDQKEGKVKIKLIYYIIISLKIGLISALFGIIYRFYDFLYRQTISSMFYSIGAVIVLLAILIYLEEFGKLRTKKRYTFFFYFSSYSFTVYLAHDPLYFLFYSQLNGLLIWVPVIGMIIVITLILKVLYNKVGSKASLKAQLGVLSLIIVNKIEQRKSRK